MTNTIALSLALGTKGFAIYGAAAGDRSGYSVASAGDVNGDGYDDVIIGNSGVGPSYVIYGGVTNFTEIDLASLGSKGFAIYGAAANDQSGWSVASAGDVNGDGYDDVIIGAPQATPNGRSGAGTSYVIYGNVTNPGTIDLSLALGTRGFAINGAVANDRSGRSVSSAGDVNGDGYSDIIIGAPPATPNGRGFAGTSYVIYGKNASFTDIDLASLSFAQGFKILGAAAGDNSGCSVASAGDVNGDGLSDIIIGAYGADPNGRTNAGTSYVIYGKNTSFSDIDLASLGSSGFAIYGGGGTGSDYSGNSVASAGDVNGDGLSDIIIGAYGANPYFRGSFTGISYVIYGNYSNPGTIDLLFDLGSLGFVVLGAAANDYSGWSVASAGDINGDGYSDIIIGAYGVDLKFYPIAEYLYASNAGTSYVIYGSAGNPGTIDLAVSLGTRGFRIDGGADNDYSGWSVASAGDVNGDGLSDIIIGAYGADPNGRSNAGTSYVIYGESTPGPSLSPSFQPTAQGDHQMLNCDGGSGKTTWIDFNGDSKADFICELLNGRIELCLSTGGTVECIGELMYTLANSTLLQPLMCASGNNLGKITWVDFNGDDMADFICEFQGGNIEVCLSTGEAAECLGELIYTFTNSTTV